MTRDSDIIATLKVGGISTANGSDLDFGEVFIGTVGNQVTPRALGTVTVRGGELTLMTSVVSGSFSIAFPGSIMSLTLSEVQNSPIFNVSNGGTLIVQASKLSASAGAGGIVRAEGMTGVIGSLAGADIEIDGSTLTAVNLRGMQRITNTTITHTIGPAFITNCDVYLESVLLESSQPLQVGVTSPSIVTELVVNNTVLESSIATVLSPGTGRTSVELEGASLWRSFGNFTVMHVMTELDINSGSRIDAQADFWIAGALVTVGSGVGTDSRIDVAGDLELFGGVPAAVLTIEDGAVIDVDGTLTIGPLAIVNLNGGLLRVGNLVNQGVLNENGGTLIVPEPSAGTSAIAACLALALLRKQRRRAPRSTAMASSAT